MNAGFVLIPILLLRYGLLALISGEALKRAAYFPPLRDNEKWAFWVYQISLLGMFAYHFFLTIETDSAWFFAGLCEYALGTVLYAVSIINFAKPKAGGINTKGLYKLSRNPMYIAFFIYFLGSAIMTCSLILLGILIVFQISVHVMILSEERWCAGQFGDEYREYMSRVRRYI